MTYICNNADSTCDDCAALNGQIFDISNAEEGVNLPPIHPNCRCVVRGYPALPESETMADFLEAVAEVSIAAITDQASGKIRGIFDQLSEALGVIWSALFEQSILDYYGTFTTIEIDGVEYHINRNNFTAAAIGPDGKLIVPENAKPYDEQMLTLMKLRDSLPEGSAKRTEIEQEIERLKNEDKNNHEEICGTKHRDTHNSTNCRRFFPCNTNPMDPHIRCQFDSRFYILFLWWG